jgi:hypothetical protein
MFAVETSTRSNDDSHQCIDECLFAMNKMIELRDFKQVFISEIISNHIEIDQIRQDVNSFLLHNYLVLTRELLNDFCLFWPGKSERERERERWTDKQLEKRKNTRQDRCRTNTEIQLYSTENIDLNR